MRISAAVAVAILLAVSGASSADAQELQRDDDLMSSMGIVGYDPETGEVGIAMASRFFAVGYVAIHARGGVGAIATMGGAPYKDGPLMLDWLEQGATPEQVLERLRETYDNIGQIALVDAEGRSIATTSETSSEWKGHRWGENYATAGNILAGPQVVDGFAETFEETAGSGLPLAERLMMALEAADAAGGDARGRMAAGLKVYQPGAGFGGTDLYLDVRVDDSPNSISDLRDLYERWKVERLQQYGTRMIQQTNGADVGKLQDWLVQLGYLERSNRQVFDGQGRPMGVFNDATVSAVVAFKEDHELGSDSSANREVIIKMIDLLDIEEPTGPISSTWSNPLRRRGGGGRLNVRSSVPPLALGLSAMGVLPGYGQEQPVASPENVITSLSIAGYDPETGEVGIAMSSRFFAVAPIAVHVRAGVGAVATMGGSPYADAQEMLDWLEEGVSPEDVIDRLKDRYGESWGGGQINIVDTQGRSIAATGTETWWKGGRWGRNYATSGNILAGPEVVDGFADTFEATEGSGMPLAERLLKSLEAADRAGGDARGRMAATLVVKKPGAGVFGIDDYVNLRIDDSRRAIHDLSNLYYRWRSIRNEEPGFRVMERSQGDDVRWLQNALAELGYVARDEGGIFGPDGQPNGVLNDATVQALVRYKIDHQLGATPGAGRETILRIQRELEGRPLSRR